MDVHSCLQMLRLRGQQNRQYSARATGATSPNVFGPHFQLHVQNRCTLEQLSLCTCNTCHTLVQLSLCTCKLGTLHVREMVAHATLDLLICCTCKTMCSDRCTSKRLACWFVARAVEYRCTCNCLSLHVQKLCAPAKTRGLQEMTQFPICTCLFTDKANS